MVVVLVVQYVAPIWLIPLFIRFIPLPSGSLREAVVGYARAVGVEGVAVFEIDGSRRSAKGGAFVTGIGNNRRIGIFDTFIRRHTTPEVVAVVAHEVGHYKNGHGFKKMLIGMLNLGLMCYLMLLFVYERALHEAFFMEQSSLYAGLVFFIMLVTPLELMVDLLLKWLSRRYEFEADRFAVTTSPDATALVSSLKKLAVGNLDHLAPHPFYVFLYQSHPPLIQRLAAINAYLDAGNEPARAGRGKRS